MGRGQYCSSRHKKDNISLKTTLFVMAEFDADESCMKRAPSCHILLYAYTCFMTSSKLQLQAAIFFYLNDVCQRVVFLPSFFPFLATIM